MSNGKISGKVIGMTVFACFISFFVYISLFLLLQAFSTKTGGYMVFYKDENGNSVDVELVEELPEKSELPENYGYRIVRTEMPTAATVTLGIIQTVCGLGIVFCTAGTPIANAAAKDRNKTDFDKEKYDKLRGFKIGAVAAIPSFVFWLAAFLLRFVTPSALTHGYYWFYRWGVLSPVKPVADLITGNAAALEEIPAGAVFALIIFTAVLIAFCGVLYIICFNEESVIAKLLYKSAAKPEKPQRRLR